MHDIGIQYVFICVWCVDRFNSYAHMNDVIMYIVLQPLSDRRFPRITATAAIAPILNLSAPSKGIQCLHTGL